MNFTLKANKLNKSLANDTNAEVLGVVHDAYNLFFEDSIITRDGRYLVTGRTKLMLLGWNLGGRPRVFS